MTTVRRVMLCATLMMPGALLRAQWYVDYQAGKDALEKQQWQSAVSHFARALEDEPDSKANKKTYGYVFIDYFPYLYRGIAYYKLGDVAGARSDLEKAKSEGVIGDAERDQDAAKLLDQYTALLAKPAPQIAQKKQEQNPPETAKQNPPLPSQGQKTAEIRKPAEPSGPLAAKSEPKKEANPVPEKGRVSEQKKMEPGPGTASESRVPAVVTKPAGPDTTGSGLFTEAAALFNSGKVAQAKTRFESLRQRIPAYPGLADYLRLIESVETRTSAGIASYFQGEYRDAIEQLTSSSKNGSDNPHLYAVLACSYAAEYLLAGEEDGSLKKEAVAAFGRTRALDPRYELDSGLISPRIIALLTGR
ncbi:MAG TPA: hypothetical protein VL221_04255 [Bacteroidota bacterium]|nr:hypothetical protein [Bacteroidota bacterium]